MLAMMQESVLHSSILHVRLLLCNALSHVCTRHVGHKAVSTWIVHGFGLGRGAHTEAACQCYLPEVGLRLLDGGQFYQIQR